MFWTNFSSSKLVLPWLLLPLAVFAFFALKVEPWVQLYTTSNNPRQAAIDNGGEDYDQLDYENEDFYEDDSFTDEEDTVGFAEEPTDGVGWEYARWCFGLSTFLAIAANFILLLVIPCALGGFDAGKKRFQFWMGFFINISLMVGLTLLYYLVYDLDKNTDTAISTTFLILLGLHAISFMATYIVGSRFVSPAYRKAFWFA